MRLRIAFLACAGAVALALGGSALAAYTPRLVVGHTPLATSGGGQTDVIVQVPSTDDATAKVTIYAPQGYTGTLGVAAGTQLGTVNATAIVKAISPDQPVPINGTIVSDDPAKHVANPCSPGTHEGVWILNLEAAGQQLPVPAYVDTVTAPQEAALGKFKIQVCLRSPDIPVSAGGSPLGAKLVTAALHLRNVFTLPVQGGSYGWTLIATPYTPGTGTPNAAGTVQARAMVQLPAQVAVKVTRARRGRSVTLAGLLRVGGAGLAGTRVTLYAGTSRTRLRAAGSTTTRAGGAYSFRRTVARTTFFQVRVTAAVRSTSCTGGVPGVPCVGATLNPFSVRSAIVRVTARRR